VLARLSEPEREVAVAVGRGRSNAGISDELFMSIATVNAQVSSMLTKLDLNDRTQIALLSSRRRADQLNAEPAYVPLPRWQAMRRRLSGPADRPA
jgi:DNA-binding CsgD family transcriptional regulator